jgi:hypothetical protein
MLRRIGVALTVGLADSVNPSTIGPALFLATAPRRVLRVVQFTVGVFAVTLAAGLVLTIGPGRLLLGLVPHPHGTVRHVIELVAGVILFAVAVAIWRGRPLGVNHGRLARRGRASDRRAIFRGDRCDRVVDREAS